MKQKVAEPEYDFTTGLPELPGTSFLWRVGPREGCESGYDGDEYGFGVSLCLSYPNWRGKDRVDHLYRSGIIYGVPTKDDLRAEAVMMLAQLQRDSDREAAVREFSGDYPPRKLM